jgi:hypothetical protein
MNPSVASAGTDVMRLAEVDSISATFMVSDTKINDGCTTDGASLTVIGSPMLSVLGRLTDGESLSPTVSPTLTVTG